MFNKAVFIGINESQISPEYWKRIDSVIKKRVHLNADAPEIKKELSDTDCLLVGFGILIDKDYIDSAPKLKYIGVLATAYDKVDTAHSRNRSISVCNVAGYSTEAVAEFAFAAILEHIRNLEKSKQLGREGLNEPTGYFGSEIKNKVFGVLGTGKIGSRVAEIAQGFGADVRYWSRNRKPQLESKGIKYEEADKFIPICDFLSLNFSTTKETKNFLNKSRVQKLKSGVTVIQAVSLETVDVDAMEERLNKNDISFIFENSEETQQDIFKRLSQHKNCIVYPITAFATKESMALRQKIFVENIENFLKGSPTNVVN